MPITIEEKMGRTLSDRSAELTFILRGSSSDSEVRQALSNHASPFHNGIKRNNVEVEELTDNLWLGIVRYAKPQSSSLDEGQSSFNFDTGGGSQHITQSLQTVHRYGSSGNTAPDFKGAIGVTEGRVEGVDITVPVYHFSETHHFSSSQVDNAYKGVLFHLTGKVNSNNFRGLNAGECLFLGASGSQRSDDDGWEITFRFAGSPNRSNLSIGYISGISKKGWEYLWVRYADAVDDSSNTLVKQPVAAYVEQVYEEASFSGLGI
ncbi:hypothetical protein KS4_10970 [Poriferisphaera corsica]|uniref:Uncharacterized protein n=1 Tax=Poriferisphaera corsica TaxID=2528020 RepID=A0A517YS73_9BACT|nr:hypothetical protein [Poriferisphaera corsica]QDU33056.1 hypothetical protein KS4_10970 [Poriferisphaera corsica]